MTVREELIALVMNREFLRKHRYYAFLLAQLEVIDDPMVDVMAVSRSPRGFRLHVNQMFVAAEPQWVPGVLLHEVHHIVLGHLTDERFVSVRYPRLLQLAMEMSANEFIREPLPGRPVVWNDFTEHGILPRQSTLERYDRLARALEEGCEIRHSAALDDHLEAGVGAAGNGKRDWLPIDPLPGLICRAVESADKSTNTAEMAPGGGMLAGTTPGHLLEQLDTTPTPPTWCLDWRAALAQFVAPLARTWRLVWSRPNRRFPDRVGQIPGRARRASASKLSHLLVAIDTSGSMSALELAEIGRHLRRLSDLVDITIVECDAAIGRVYPYKGSLPNVAGRGGTDLRAVFAPAFLRKMRPAGIVYFTDGMGPWPAESPGVETLWVLTKRYPFACPWGRRASLAGANETPLEKGDILLFQVGEAQKNQGVPDFHTQSLSLAEGPESF
jgi:predicted metal-dependent peptidase